MTVYRFRRRRPAVLATTPSCSACRAPALLMQSCGACGRDRCPSCYGDWLGLSCQSCRAEAQGGRLRVA